MHRLCLTLVAAAFLCGSAALTSDNPLPRWLDEEIERAKKHHSYLVIWEVTIGGTWRHDYLDGRRAYHFSRGSGMYNLLSEKGKWLCLRGGYADDVKSGSCPGLVSLVRLVYPIDPNEPAQSRRRPGGWGLY